MKRILKIALLLCTTIILSNCSSGGDYDETQYPKNPTERQRERIGKITGEDGLVLFGGSKKGRKAQSSEGGVGIGVNSYLWRASLDTLSFMPLASADPFGGVIITDWYENPESRGERFKVNVLITDTDLKASALNVSAFKQETSAGKWVDASVGADVASELENKILTRARELRIEKEQEL